MNITLTVFQIVISILLISLILFQSQGTGLGDIFGGQGGSFHTKRGAEKLLFNLTIILGVSFLLISTINAFFI
jgi:preprotein translocase subunit SecG